MKLWQLLESGHRDQDTGKIVVTFHAELYEQPLWAHLRGKLTQWAWMHCPRWATRHHGERRRLNFELAFTWDIPNARRRIIEMVQVADRDPATWWKPGGDAPLPKAQEGP